jgi:hypothetical protein
MSNSLARSDSNNGQSVAVGDLEKEHTLKFSQRRVFGGSRTFELVNPRQLKITFKRLSGSNIELIDLYNLDLKYERIVYREIKWLVLAVIAMAMVVMAGYTAYDNASTAPLGTAILFGGISIALICLFIHRGQDQYVFRVYQSDEPGLLMWANKPSLDAATAFADHLVELINKQRLDPRMSDEDRLEVYANHLGFLVDEEVLSEKEAEQIFVRKQKRLAKASSKRVVSLVK